MFYLEKAQAIKKLMEIRGWSEMLAASTLGISRIQIQRLLSLVDAPKEVMEIKGWNEFLAARNLGISEISSLLGLSSTAVSKVSDPAVKPLFHCFFVSVVKRQVKVVL